MAIKKTIQWIIAIILVTTVVVAIDWHYCHQTALSGDNLKESKK